METRKAISENGHETIQSDRPVRGQRDAGIIIGVSILLAAVALACFVAIMPS